MKGSHGKMQGTRRKLKKGEKTSPSEYLKEFNRGKKVQVKIDPSSHDGMPNPKFHGLVGEIIGKRGKAYRVKVKDKNKEKELFVRPEHLKDIEED